MIAYNGVTVNGIGGGKITTNETKTITITNNTATSGTLNVEFNLREVLSYGTYLDTATLVFTLAE